MQVLDAASCQKIIARVGVRVDDLRTINTSRFPYPDEIRSDKQAKAAATQKVLRREVNDVLPLLSTSPEERMMATLVVVLDIAGAYTSNRHSTENALYGVLCVGGRVCMSTASARYVL